MIIDSFLLFFEKFNDCDSCKYKDSAEFFTDLLKKQKKNTKPL